MALTASGRQRKASVARVARAAYRWRGNAGVGGRAPTPRSNSGSDGKRQERVPSGVGVGGTGGERRVPVHGAVPAVPARRAVTSGAR